MGANPRTLYPTYNNFILKSVNLHIQIKTKDGIEEMCRHCDFCAVYCPT